MKKTMLTLLLIFLIFTPLIVLADGANTVGSGGSVTLDNPLGKDVTPQIVIGRVINAILGLVGSLALIMFIYGGFVWMTAAGSPEKIAKGRAILMWATIGLVVIFSSYSLVNFIIKRGLGA